MTRGIVIFCVTVMTLSGCSSAAITIGVAAASYVASVNNLGAETLSLVASPPPHCPAPAENN